MLTEGMILGDKIMFIVNIILTTDRIIGTNIMFTVKCSQNAHF